MPVGTSSVTGRGRPGILRRLTDASDSKQQQATASDSKRQHSAKQDGKEPNAGVRRNVGSRWAA
jgi:hypothetical protein